MERDNKQQTMNANSIGVVAFDPVLDYMDRISTTIFSVLTPEQQNKCCVIFGDRVLKTFDTLEDCIRSQETDFPFLLTMLYIPSRSSAIQLLNV